MKNNKQYKINSLLRMAEITEDSEKIRFYLQEAENLLFGVEDGSECSVETEKGLIPQVQFEHLQDFYNCYKEDIIGKKNTYAYELYKKFCSENEIIPIDKGSFCKRMTLYFPLKTYNTHEYRADGVRVGVRIWVDK